MLTIPNRLAAIATVLAAGAALAGLVLTSLYVDARTGRSRRAAPIWRRCSWPFLSWPSAC
jgi:hypothetical protein